MSLLIIIVAAAAVLFGIPLVLFPRGSLGNFLAGFTSIISGVVAYNKQSLIPPLVGFGILCLLRIFGLDNKR